MPGNIITFDTFSNAYDSLETSLRVLEWENDHRWKWFAFSIHHALYMFCTEAIHQGNFELLLKSGHNPDEGWFVYDEENETWLKSNTRYIEKPAYEIIWEPTDEDPPEKEKDEISYGNWLIKFWSALARVQDDVFWMNRMMYITAIELTDEEWEAVLFLTNKIRNELTHFVPKTMNYHIDDFKINGSHFVNIIDRLINESHAVDLPFDDHEVWHERINEIIAELRIHLNA